MSKNFLLIVNPLSGKKNGKAIALYIQEKLTENGYNCHLFISQTINHLTNYIKELNLNDFKAIGIVGGDGSMHEFINAALATSLTIEPPVALFPCGTGNAFNFDIGCSTIDETLACILSNTTSFIDVAEVNYHDKRLWSFNILGCGLVADINCLAEKMRWLGASRYNIASVIKLLANPAVELTIKTDEGTLSGQFSFVLACNTRYTGKGMMMAPHAQLNDEKFDILVVQACSVWKLLTLFPKIFKGKHLGSEVLRYIQSGSLKITTINSLATNIDGELKGHTPFEMKVHKNKVRVFVKNQK